MHRLSVVSCVVLLIELCGAKTVWQNIPVFTDQDCSDDFVAKVGLQTDEGDCMGLACSSYPDTPVYVTAQCTDNPAFPNSGGILIKTFDNALCSEVPDMYYWMKPGCNLGMYVECQAEAVVFSDCSASPDCDLSLCNYTDSLPLNTCDYYGEDMYGTVECQAATVDEGLSGGAIFGIVAGVLGGIGLAAGAAVGAVWFFMYRKPAAKTYEPVGGPVQISE
ncbi:hypothetical protein Pelo_299 [Pelomyxa schiedti]|nr:hypothetical protein Pelo_299 [Pelomyxa schiedti]